MTRYVYQLEGLRKVLEGGREILRGLNLAFFDGAKIGVIGANGAGKSTLLRIMAGVETDYEGKAYAAPGLRIGYLAQEPKLDPGKDVRGNVEEGVAATRALLERFDKVTERLGEDLSPAEMDKLIAEQADVQERIDAADAWELDRRIDIAMDALRVPPGDADVARISGGERRRVALCRLLLSQPDMLLLDEPTNHLDAESVQWLERHLAEYKGTIIAVTHDRYFLDNVAQWILEMDHGYGIPWKGNYSSWLDQKKQRLAVEEKQATARQRTLERELEWINMSPRARQAKSKARVTAYESLLRESERETDGGVEIMIPVPQRLGDKVVVAEGLRKGYGDKLLFDNLTFSLPPGGIVGVIGPNGAGKTTLFRLITGQETPDAGELTVGDTVQLAYVDQSRDALDAGKTVFEEITGGETELRFGRRTVNPRAYCAGFNFRGADQQKKVGELSGGERNRVHLAKLLRTGGNLLLLDEPTNDLDVDTLRALEEALLHFAGCAVVISHDRWFLDRIATHILAFEGDSEVFFYEGNFQDYDADWHRRKGTEARPTRIKYRKLAK
ncbi:MAG TPA: energy-dependent translational throttle protein EttA [Planctomycetota bacterium]|nr:energy-dependent translational throttle protein EttA [Planctomycetota bacterium]